MSKVIPITSQSHFKATLGATNYLVVDFYADWCGPCKTISPVFEQIAAAESKPGLITFCKVNVDNQRDVASTYGISAMPTFMVLKGSTVVETVRGANAGALRQAILSAAASAAKGTPRSAASFTGRGQTLGSESSTFAATRSAGSASRTIASVGTGPATFAQGSGVANVAVRFVALYLSTLFSLDPNKTAEESSFRLNRPSGQKLR